MKKILITGGAGFIGSHLAEYLLKKGYFVTVVDNLSNGTTAYLKDVLGHPSFAYHQGSVLDRELMDRLIKDHDAVYHMAAVLGVKNTVDDPLKVIEGNIDGTRMILKLADHYQKKVIFASTSEIYGKNPRLPYAEDSDRLLGDPSIHRWCYATAKALDEHLCFGYAKKGLPVTVVRFFNVYGPRQTYSAYGGVIPIFITKALSGKPLPIFGDGNQVRSFGYVGDVVKGLEAALSPAADHQAINLGAREPMTISELAKKIAALTGSEAGFEYIPYQKAYGDGFEEIPARIPSLDKAGKLLNYTAATPFATGLKETIDWYRMRIAKAHHDELAKH
ncbi:NAD-dependent epimerase/dehydratase family protein [Sporolactobacillus sp. CQH2019]|uniref:NAD-dependent epimerase/dehydratase family protein n=1 Tax=Sporolactobacillus sp. CQH2019 TaxID=3023512 RepID=UPI0023682A4A|nr:NAD-dependent epimerase/dehydratase family protein [Sporolactobacillus sp. CQH2019]MDD9148430.1 NAD-dependent epimerase/dehydratase family protein [Sporolactobacillus sp. CQH2019]